MNTEKIAESRVQQRIGETGDISQMSPTEIKAAFHELMVKLIQLEMQNEELTRTDVECEAKNVKCNNLYDFSPVGYYTLDPEGIIIEANRFAAGQLGLERSDLIKSEFAVNVSPDNRTLFGEFLHRVFASDTRQTIELKLISTSGFLLNVQLEGVHIQTLTGQSHCRLAVVDISERKKAEERIQWLSTFPEQNPNPIVEVDTTGNITYANAAAKNVFPDLTTSRGKHPFLEDILSTFNQHENTHEHTHAFETEIDGRWFQKEFYHSEDFNRLRIYGTDITKRKLAEKKLHESEEKYRRIIETVNEGIVIADKEGKIEFVNDKMADMLGYRIDDIIGKWGVDFLAKEQKEKITANREKLVSNNNIKDEYCFLRKDGTPLWTVGSSSTLFDDNGTYIANLSMHTDITERKRAEQAKQNALDRFYLVLSNMTFGVLLVTGDGLIEFANQHFCDMYHLKETPEELRKFTSREIVEKIRNEYVDPDQAATRIREIVDLRQTVHDEEIVMRDGRIYLRDYIPIPLSENKVSRLWTQKEITKLKHVENALRDSRERLDLALLSSRMGIFDWDIINDKRTWSSGVHALLGTKPETFTGTAEEFFEAIHPEDRNTVQSALAKALKTGEYETEYRVVWPNGSIHSIAARGKVHRNNAGHAVLMIGVCWDITDRKKTEEALLASNRELEQFAYVASHDLQEPLRMVASFTNLLEHRAQGLLDEKSQTFMRYIIEGSSRMQTLIEDLLAFSRVGRLEAARHLVNCNSILDNVITDLSKTIKVKNATITHDNLPRLMANESTMSRLFMNLVSNALKFCKKEEPPRIHIAVVRTHNEWQFAVSDNGIGINPKYFDKIFMIFQRLHGRDEYPGSGMGLAICKKIVTNYGGKIWVQSQPDKGTTFYFTIPQLENKNE
ncbi:MAG: PAS domain S-box protein [Endomicrobiales bacterium]|jgi:PAS domain S-box-containing protein